MEYISLGKERDQWEKVYRGKEEFVMANILQGRVQKVVVVKGTEQATRGSSQLESWRREVQAVAVGFEDANKFYILMVSGKGN